MRYRELGAETCGLDVCADQLLNIVAGDVSRLEEWQETINGCDLVVHTAAIVSITSRARKLGASIYWGHAAFWRPPFTRGQNVLSTFPR